MTSNRRAEGSPEHHEIREIIPWYVNETLAAHERQRVEAHLEVCAACRDDLLAEQRIFEGIAGRTSIEYMAAPSLKRFLARLDGAQTTVAEEDPAEQPRRKMPWRGLLAASTMLMAVTIGALMADQWAKYRANVAAPNYRTVTNSTPRSPEEAIRAVFAPTITLVELQAILEESNLRIISGPTEAGVYSLAATSSRPVASSLALLRQHSTVRFAEETGQEPAPGESR